jgi:branched-chain amino acid transport system permease protein
MDPLYLQVLFGGLTAGSTYAMLALGFTLAYRSTRIINFAHGEFVMLGAFVAITGVGAFKLPLPLAIGVAIVVVAAIGVVFERLLLRPVRGQPAFVLILITVGASFLLRGVAMVVWGSEALNLPAFSGEQPLVIGGASLVPQVVWIVTTAALSVTLLSLFLNRTLYGKALRACAENQTAATLVGINVGAAVLVSYLISAALGALAGVLITPITAMDYQAGFLLAMKGLTGAIIGGLQRVEGVVAGAVLLGLIEAFGATFVSSLLKDALVYLVLILVLSLRPQGLFSGPTTR